VSEDEFCTNSAPRREGAGFVLECTFRTLYILTRRAYGRPYALCVALFNVSRCLDTQGIRPYALCVMLFNISRRLIFRAYCVVVGGIPTHS
jgi:hypothetical protein